MAGGGEGGRRDSREAGLSKLGHVTYTCEGGKGDMSFSHLIKKLNSDLTRKAIKGAGFLGVLGSFRKGFKWGLEGVSNGVWKGFQMGFGRGFKWGLEGVSNGVWKGFQMGFGRGFKWGLGVFEGVWGDSLEEVFGEVQKRFEGF